MPVDSVTESFFYSVDGDAVFAVDYHGYIAAPERLVEDSPNFEYRAVYGSVLVVNIWVCGDIEQIAVDYCAGLILRWQ